MKPIRLLVVDDYDLFRQGLMSLLRAEPAFELVGEAASGEEAVRLAKGTEPDVVLVDLFMPSMTGTDLIAQLLARRPELRVVVLTASEDEADLVTALLAGARGYASKSSNVESLFGVIWHVHAGGVALCPIAALRMLKILRNLTAPRSANVPLTAREQEILALIMTGADNAKIARRLAITENTVERRVSRLLEKLGMHYRSDLIALGDGGRTRR